MTAARIFRKYLSTNHIMFMACLLLGVLTQFASLAQPRISDTFITAVQNHENTAQPICLFIIAILVIMILSILQQMLEGKYSQSIVRDTRTKLSEKFFSLPVLTQESKSPTWFSQRIANDTELIEPVPSNAISIVENIILGAGAAIALIHLDIYAFMIGISIAIIALLVMTLSAKPLQSWQQHIQNAQMNMTATVQEATSTNRVLRAYNAMHVSMEQMKRAIEESYTYSYRLSLLLGALGPIIQVLMQFASIGTILFASYQMAKGTLQFADLVAFIMYFSYFSSSITGMSQTISSIQESITGETRMQELEKEAANSKVKIQNSETQKFITPPQIDFKEISFRYPDCQSNALSNVSFSIPAGKTTAIVGSSGGGKTTCLGMIERFYEPQSGSITVNGEEISNLNLSTYRGYVSYVDQNSVLATGTIRDNLNLGDTSYSDHEMLAALRRVGLTELIQTNHCSLLDKPVGEQGLSLSGGQKQRLSIARALLHHPSLLVMDEPTSDLDGLSEQKIINLLTAHKNKLTLCYTAHRLSTILKADWIVVIDHGKVLAQGQHKQLMENCAYYKTLITSQIGEEKTINS